MDSNALPRRVQSRAPSHDSTIDPETVRRVLLDQRARRRSIMLAGASPEQADLYDWLWIQAGCRERAIAFADAEVVADMVASARILPRQIAALARLGVVDELRRERGRGKRTEVYVRDAVTVLAATLRPAKCSPQRPLPGMDEEADSAETGGDEKPELRAHIGAHIGAPVVRVFPENTPYIRAHGYEGDDRDENKALRSKNSSPELEAHHHPSHPKSRLPSDPYERAAIGDRVIEVAGDLLARLREPVGLRRSCILTIAYLQVASGHISQAEVEAALEAAQRPGDAAKTRDPGRLFVGGIKAIIFRHADALAGHPLFAGRDPRQAKTSREVRFPAHKMLRACMRELQIEPDGRWFEEIGGKPR
jgi:hypothetical protein